MKEFKLEELDFRSISRESDRCLSVVYVFPDPYSPQKVWIRAGQAEIRIEDRSSRFTVRMTEGVTDQEHDSAYVLQLPLIGVKFTHVWSHQACFTCWVDPNDEEGFHVPDAGYDPTKHKDAYQCDNKKYCDDVGHWVVPYFVPPVNRKLYELMRGKKLEIMLSPVYPEEKTDK